MSHIRSMVDRIGPAKNPDDLWQVALSFLPDLGLSKVVFYDLSNATTPFIRSNAAQAWTDTYAAHVRSGQDPFATHCLSRPGSVLTGIAHLDAHAYLDNDARNLVEQSSETLNIQASMSVTICPDVTGAGIGWNLMTPCSAVEFADLRADREADWRAWCQVTFAGLAMTGQHMPSPVLTSREHDCLAFIADGLRTADIAYRLGIAGTTVEMHLRGARKRLGADTRDQAVAIAVRRNLI